MRIHLLLILLTISGVEAADPLPIDPLWKSESFRKTITASYGIDSRIEPRITEDEAFYLDKSAEGMAAGDRDAAIKTLSESSLLARSPAMLFSLATLQFEAGRSGEARKRFGEAIEQFPNFRDAHRNLGVVLVQEEDFEKAKLHLSRALELGSQDGLTLGLLGYCHARDARHQAALDAYRLAMLTQPGERQWQIGEAQSLQALGQSRAAAGIYQSIIDTEPGETNLWLAQADAWIDLDESLKAAANLELVHRSGDLNASATLSLGHLYLQNNLPSLALDRYRAAIVAPEPVVLARAVEALDLLVNAADWARGKELATLIESSDSYRSALAPDSADKEILSRLTRGHALIELETGDGEAGAKRVDEWLKREPLDGQALILLARFREEGGKREEAEMLLEQAARIPDAAAEAHLAHGRLLVSESEYAAAVEHLEKSYAIHPHESLAAYIEAVKELDP